VPGPLWVRRSGSGHAVLFIHGLGASSRYWGGATAILPDVASVAPDLLGFGRSPAPPEATYDVTGHVAALTPLLTEPMVVVGHSAGAILAAALARSHPEQVRGLVLAGLPVFPDPATARAEVGTLSLLARLTVEERPAAQWLCAAMCHLRPLAIAAAPLLAPGLPRRVAADGARHTWRSFSQTLQHVVVEHPVADDIAHIGAPVELVHGQDDPTASLERVRSLAAERQARGQRIALTVAPGGHHLPLSRPDVVARAIQRLIAGR
jgi:pimeloyl-ACP methyl ester carboxylesterase